MIRCRRAVTTLLLALAVIPVTTAGAQGTGGPPAGGTSDRGPRAERRHVFSLNPLLPLAGFVQGEFETRLRRTLTLAVSGAHMRLDDLYTSGDVKLRFYPGERALHGFGIAAGAGYGRIENDDNVPLCADVFPGDVVPRCRIVRQVTRAPSVSVEAHYQWLLGASRATVFTLGGGVKRYYVGDDGFPAADLYMEFVPTLRMTVGYAFR